MSTTDPRAEQPTTAAPSTSLHSVGDVAREIDVPPSTLRTWERRYDLGPSARSAGGHRRYDDHDLELLRRMSVLVGRGVSPGAAARAVLRSGTDATAISSTELADAVITAARAYDSTLLRTLFTKCLDTYGTAEAWTTHIAPSLRRVGEEWLSGGLGVEGEHLVSDALLTVLRARFARHRGLPMQHRDVLLASAEDEQHSLPLVALQAALADVDIACHVLGQRTPATALAGMIIRLDPAAVFLWASLPRLGSTSLRAVHEAAAGRAAVLLGGPGWEGSDTSGATYLKDLPGAVAAVLEAVAADPDA